MVSVVGIFLLLESREKATDSFREGLTETCTVVCATSPQDVWLGSSGSLLPGYEARIMSPDGKELTGYDQPGELVVRSPTVVLGYLNNEKANKETFEDGWMRTGDEAVIRLSPNNTEHIFIVDRIKELIKVKVRIPHYLVEYMCHQVRIALLTDSYRACKLHQPNSKPTFSPIPPWSTAPSSAFQTMPQEKFPRPLWSSHHLQVMTMQRSPNRSRNTSRTTRRGTSG